METRDEDLAMAASRGDRDAFAALIARHYDRMLSLGWRLSGSQSDAQDLVQDICVALPAKLAGFRAQSRFSTWLYRVIVNAAHDRRRRQASQARAAQGWGDWEIGRQDDIAREREALSWLQSAMRALPEDLRDTAVLILDEELSQREAAEILQIPEGTIAWRMSEIKKRLRALAQQEATP